MSTAPKIVGPVKEEIVTLKILRGISLNAQTFSGQSNPDTIWRLMVAGDPLAASYYREILEKDSAVVAAFETRKRLVLARERNVVAADQNSEQAKLYASEFAALLDSIPSFDAVLDEILDAVPFGYTVQEILWGQGDTSHAWMSPKLIGRPQELFRFGRLTEPQIGDLLLSEFPGGEGRPVPPAKFLVSTFQPRQGDRRGLPLLRRVFWLSWIKRNALRLHLKFLEKGPGTIVVLYSNEGDEQKALDLGAMIHEETYGAARDGMKVMPELLTNTRIRDAADYQALFSYCDAENTRIVLGQTMTTRGGEQGKGTQALGRVHEGTEDEITRSDATLVENVINEQLGTPWLLWRFGLAALDRAVRPWWTIQKEPPKDAERELRVVAAARNVGLRVPEEEAYRAAGIRAPEEGEAVLPPPSFSPEMLPPTEEIPES